MHREGKHSFASLIARGVRNVSLQRNIYAHNMARNPRLDSNITANVINNYMYNVGWHGVEIRNASSLGSLPTTANIIGNAQGILASNSTGAPLIQVQSKQGYILNSVYQSDNLYTTSLYKNIKPGTLNAGEKMVPDSEIFAAAPVLPLAGLDIMPASAVPAYVILNAGARPGDRDRVDQRFIDQIKTGRGAVLNTPDANEWNELMRMSDPANATRRAFPDVAAPWSSKCVRGIFA